METRGTDMAVGPVFQGPVTARVAGLGFSAMAVEAMVFHVRPCVVKEDSSTGGVMT